MFLESKVLGTDKEGIYKAIEYYIDMMEYDDIKFVRTGKWEDKYLIEVVVKSYSGRIVMHLYFTSNDDYTLFLAEKLVYGIVEYLNWVYRHEFKENNNFLYVDELITAVKFVLVDGV